MATMARTAVALALAAALAGCGQGAEGDGTVAAASQTSGEMTALAACLREQGVEPPEGGPVRQQREGAPGGGATGADAGAAPGRGDGPRMRLPDDPEMRAAYEACREHLPTGVRPGGAMAEAEAYLACLRDNGVEADNAAALRDLDAGEPETAAAMETCAPLRPEAGRRPAAGTPTAGT